MFFFIYTNEQINAICAHLKPLPSIMKIDKKRHNDTIIAGVVIIGIIFWIPMQKYNCLHPMTVYVGTIFQCIFSTLQFLPLATVKKHTGFKTVTRVGSIFFSFSKRDHSPDRWWFVEPAIAVFFLFTKYYFLLFSLVVNGVCYPRLDLIFGSDG